MSSDGGFQAVRAAGEPLQIRTVYRHFMLFYVIGRIQASILYVFSAEFIRTSRCRS